MSSNLALDAGLTAAFSSGAWAEGTNANTIKSTATVTYVIDGQFYSKSATDNVAISYSGPSVYQAAAGGVQSVNGGFTGGVNGSTRLYLVCLDASGAVSIVPGQIVDSAELAAGRVALMYPDTPNAVCPVAAMRIALTAGTAFTPGSTDLSASGVTATFVNLSMVPANPIRS
jgi:hypothetical protein